MCVCVYCCELEGEKREMGNARPHHCACERLLELANRMLRGALQRALEVPGLEAALVHSLAAPHAHSPVAPGRARREVRRACHSE